MFETPKKKLYNLLNKNSSASSSDKKRWKELLLEMSDTRSFSVPSSGFTGSWWSPMIAVITVLTLLNKISNHLLNRIYILINILDGTLGGVEGQIRGYSKLDTGIQGGIEENLAFNNLRIILIRSGINKNVFKATSIEHNMSLKSMFYIGKLKDAIQDLCENSNSEESENALSYFNMVIREHYKLRSIGIKDGRKLSF